MSAVKVQFEIGHEASIRTKMTANGFTHDWEVFVRGQEGANISHFVEKVVFNLHETFAKPIRVVREPPYTLKESGYAGFNLVIEIYVKNKEEPKMIQFNYDLSLPQSGPKTYNFLKDRYVFYNPNEEFKKKLLKGGGILINNNAFYTNPEQESRNRDSVSEERHVVVSKPKMNTVETKKYKKEHKEDTPHKTSSFENLFGPPIQKPKISPDPKKSDKKGDKQTIAPKPKSKHDHKEGKPDKIKTNEDRDKSKPDKSNKNVKDDRVKDRPNKRPSDRVPSPETNKKRPSPSRRAPIPSPARSSSSLSIKEDTKAPKIKTEEKPPETKVDKEVKEKKKKDKKSHSEKDKERKERKEHKKDHSKLVHKSPKDLKDTPKESPSKVRDLPKEKDTFKEVPKPAKPTPEKVKPPSDKIKTPQDSNDRLEEQKLKDKADPERKHKHKKKDKKRDENREKHKESKEKRHKHDKREIEKPEIVEQRETPVAKDRLALPDPTSPISLDALSQCSSNKRVVADDNSGRSDSEMSVIMDEEEHKNKPASAPPEPPATSPETEIITEPPPPPHQKEKAKKHKDKSSKREEKKRKRKAIEDEEEEARKLPKMDSPTGKTESDIGEGSISTGETKVQDNGVSSSLGEVAESGALSPDYMVQLRELQQRIMTIKSNDDLERVVSLIAETGRYEVTTQTFDFDLCQLDRSTVQQLLQLMGC